MAKIEFDIHSCWTFSSLLINVFLMLLSITSVPSSHVRHIFICLQFQNFQQEWVLASLSTPLTRPCAIYLLWRNQQAGKIHVCINPKNTNLFVDLKTKWKNIITEAKLISIKSIILILNNHKSPLCDNLSYSLFNKSELVETWSSYLCKVFRSSLRNMEDFISDKPLE